MSFLSDVKDELYNPNELKKCCIKSQIYATLLFSKFFYSTPPIFKAKNKKTFDWFSCLIENDFAEYFTKETSDNKTYFLVKGDFEKRKLFSEFGYNDEIINLRINREYIPSPCCIQAFLCGAVLTCATLSSPRKEYKIEFKVHYMKLAQDLSDIILYMSNNSIKSSITRRQGIYIVYIKGAERVENFLTLIGAQKSAMTVMQIKMVKDERNRLNRMNNFDIANITRSAKAGANQANAIKIIDKKMGLDKLNDKLKYAALLRQKHPDASLAELYQLNDNISKSSLNYRLNKLIEIAKKL